MSTVVPPETHAADPRTELTVADLAAKLGDVPLFRVRMDPFPGTATRADIEAADDRGDFLGELVDGVIVEKAVAWESSVIGGWLLTLINMWNGPRGDFIVSGEQGLFWLEKDLSRAPDIAVMRRADVPGGRVPPRGFPDLAPTLAVEVLSPNDRPGEIKRKIAEYFAAGTEAVWVVDPMQERITIYASPEESREIGRGDTLVGEPVLPGFTAPVDQILDAGK